MEDLTSEKKSEVVKIIELIFKPIAAKVIGFGESYEIRSTTKVVGEDEKVSFERVYPIFISTMEGEKSMNLAGRKTPMIWDATWTACREVASQISNEATRKEISEIMHSPVVLEKRLKI